MQSNGNAGNNLDRWFSPERMKTYSFHSDPEALYLWNTRITKAFLEDIQHVEVLLRNCVDLAVSSKYGHQWYTNTDIPFNAQAKKSIRKAERRAGSARNTSPPPGRVIAELSFDFWRFLFTNTYSSTIWPLVQKTLHAIPQSNSTKRSTHIGVPSLQDFRCEVVVIYTLRNRCAHHEPIVKPNLKFEDTALDRVQGALSLVANWINPQAAQWIESNSRIPDLRRTRP